MAQLGCKLRLCCHIVNSMRELLDIFKGGFYKFALLDFGIIFEDKL